MQTFLPYASFVKSAQVLDYNRLYKQCENAALLLCSLESCFNDPDKSRLHPAELMWKGAELLLMRYASAVFEEFLHRTGNSHKHEQILRDTMFAHLCVEQSCPHWLGDEHVHSNYRAVLLFKGELDVLHKRFRVAAARGVRYERYSHSRIRHYSLADLTAATAYLNRQQIPTFANWYSQWKWSTTMTDEICWPSN